MKIAILSGKGGTGKTFVAVNLAAVAEKATYIDCDVEEPNGRLFLKPQDVRTETVCTHLPCFDAQKCTACRRCVDFCRFNALAFVADKPVVFADVCHSCGGCALICSADAVTEIEQPIGMIECGMYENVKVITGILDLGKASGVPIIKAALELVASPADELTVIDCPPGSACTVMESVRVADYCILVVEPTIFGLHNFKMVYQLVSLLGKRCGVIVNKADDGSSPSDNFCQMHKIPVLCRIPYTDKLAFIGAYAQIACQKDEKTKELFQQILETVYSEVAG